VRGGGCMGARAGVRHPRARLPVHPSAASGLPQKDRFGEGPRGGRRLHGGPDHEAPDRRRSCTRGPLVGSRDVGPRPAVAGRPGLPVQLRRPKQLAVVVGGNPWPGSVSPAAAPQAREAAGQPLARAPREFETAPAPVEAARVGRAGCAGRAPAGGGDRRGAVGGGPRSSGRPAARAEPGRRAESRTSMRAGSPICGGGGMPPLRAGQRGAGSRRPGKRSATGRGPRGPGWRGGVCPRRPSGSIGGGGRRLPPLRGRRRAAECHGRAGSTWAGDPLPSTSERRGGCRAGAGAGSSRRVPSG
jgi:hypothetical protein